MRLTRRFFWQSVLVRLGLAMGLIAALALASILSSALLTGQSEGRAAAINVAGSLRMQSYLIAATVANTREGDPGARAALDRAIADYEIRLRHPSLLGALPADASAELRAAHTRLGEAWERSVRPAALAAANDPAAHAAYLRRATAYVGDIDRLVKLLEEDLEGRLQALRFYQGVALFLIAGVIFAAMYLMHTQVVVPLTDLLASARAVRRGDLAARAANTGHDELGQLGEAFNIMMDDLARMYANLEARVAEKTEALERSNRSLELLYNAARTTSEGPATERALQGVLEDLERTLGVQARTLCLNPETGGDAFPLVAHDVDEEGRPAHCGQASCADCFASPALRERTRGAEGTIVTVPLADGGRVYGVMPLEVPPGRRLEPWQLKLAESVGLQVGSALANTRRTEERHRLALFEERSVIARELHDSLAQSLSYLKIQVALLQKRLDADKSSPEAAAVVGELRTGLANAYRQLRELLTTFRLRIDGRGLAHALEETVREFASRTKLDIRLDNRLAGVELASTEEIHVLQVVREALSNVEHHAHARRVDVILARQPGNAVRVCIDDDGRGMGEPTARPHHYGMAIMRDRATSLGGRLSVCPGPEGGTRVELEFTAATPFRGAMAA